MNFFPIAVLLNSNSGAADVNIVFSKYPIVNGVIIYNLQDLGLWNLNWKIGFPRSQDYNTPDTFLHSPSYILTDDHLFTEIRFFTLIFLEQLLSPI